MMESDDLKQLLAGNVATSVAIAASEPLREACMRLALIVEGLERFLASSTGPVPYPFRNLQQLRNDVTEAYLQATHASKSLSDLTAALRADPTAYNVDLRREVELGFALSQHLIPADTEVIVDLLDTPNVCARRGVVSLATAKLIEQCAASASLQPQSTISIRLSETQGRLHLLVADNGSGQAEVPAWLASLPAMLGIAARDVAAVTAPGQGSTVEVWFDPIVLA